LAGVNGRPVKTKEVNQPESVMEVSLVNVYKPKTSVVNGKIFHDYSMYKPDLKNCLILWR